MFSPLSRRRPLCAGAPRTLLSLFLSLTAVVAAVGQLPQALVYAAGACPTTSQFLPTPFSGGPVGAKANGLASNSATDVTVPFGTPDDLSFDVAWARSSAGEAIPSGTKVRVSIDTLGWAGPGITKADPANPGALDTVDPTLTFQGPSGPATATASIANSGSVYTVDYLLGADLPALNDAPNGTHYLEIRLNHFAGRVKGATPQALSVAYVLPGGSPVCTSSNSFNMNYAAAGVGTLKANLVKNLASPPTSTTNTLDTRGPSAPWDSAGSNATYNFQVTYTYTAGDGAAPNDPANATNGQLELTFPNLAPWNAAAVPDTTPNSGNVTVSDDAGGASAATGISGNKLFVQLTTKSTPQTVSITWKGIKPPANIDPAKQILATFSGREVSSGCAAAGAAACTGLVAIPNAADTAALAPEPGSASTFKASAVGPGVSAAGSGGCPATSVATPVTSCVAAGSALALAALTASDINGNPDSYGYNVYTGSHHIAINPLTVGDGKTPTGCGTAPASTTCTPSGSPDTLITFAKGVSTTDPAAGDGSVTFYKASNGNSVTASEASGPSGNVLANITVLGGTPGGSLSLTASPSSAAAGADQAVTLSASGLSDQYSNPASGATINFTITPPASTGGCVPVAATSPQTATTGTDSGATATYKVPGANVTCAGQYSATAAYRPTSGSAITSNVANFSITPGPVAKLAFNTITNQVLGKSFPVTISSADQYGNAISSASGGYVGSVTLADNLAKVKCVDAANCANATTTGPFTNGAWTGKVLVDVTSPAQDILYAAPSAAGSTVTCPAAAPPTPAGCASNTFNITNAPVKLALTTSGDNANKPVAGTKFTVNVTAQATDGSTVTGFADTVALGNSELGFGCDEAGCQHAFVNADNGTFTFHVTMTKAVTQTLTAADITTGSNLTPASVTETVSPGPVDGPHSSVTPAYKRLVAGQQEAVTVTVSDAYGNLQPDGTSVSLGVSTVAANCAAPTGVAASTTKGGIATFRWSGGNSRGAYCFAATSGSAAFDSRQPNSSGTYVFYDWIMDAFGHVRSVGNSPVATTSVTWNFPIARRMAVSADDTRGYVLDGYGGVHEFCLTPLGGTPCVLDANPVPKLTDYWGAPQNGGHANHPNWDIARDLAITSDGKGGYVMDGYGGVHPFGTAITMFGGTVSPRTNLSDYFTFDIARAFKLITDQYGYVLDGYGGVHTFSMDPQNEPLRSLNPGSNLSDYWGSQAAGGHPGSYNFDIAKDLVVLPTYGTPGACASCVAGDGTTRMDGYVLDGYGGLHPFRWDSTRVYPTSPTLSDYWGAPQYGGHASNPNWNIARSIGITSESQAASAQVILLDGLGGIHADASLPWDGKDAAWAGNIDIFRSNITH